MIMIVEKKKKPNNIAFEPLTQNKEVMWLLVEVLLPELHFHFAGQNYIRHETTTMEAPQKHLLLLFFCFFFLLVLF